MRRLTQRPNTLNPGQPTHHNVDPSALAKLLEQLQRAGPASQPAGPASQSWAGLRGGSGGVAVAEAGWLKAAAGCGKQQFWRAEGCHAPPTPNPATHLVCGVKARGPAAHHAKLQAAAGAATRCCRRCQLARQLAATGPEQGPKRSPRHSRQHGCQYKGRVSFPGVGKGRVAIPQKRHGFATGEMRLSGVKDAE